MKGLLAEAIQSDGSTGSYTVRVIAAGLSKNRTVYPAAVLREAAPLFEGARVFALSDREHLAMSGKDVRNLIGGLSAPVFVEGATPDQGEIQATLTLIVGESDPVATRLREAVSRSMTHLFGLSIAVEGASRPGPGGTRTAESFSKVHSVDLIVEPGAGGQIINFAEAVAQGALMNRDELLNLIRNANPTLLEGKDEAALTDEELKAILSEALKRQTPVDLITEAADIFMVMSREEIIAGINAIDPVLLEGKDVAAMGDDDLRAILGAAMTPPPEEEKKVEEQEQQKGQIAAAMVEAVVSRRLALDRRLSACGLPQSAKERVRKEFSGRTTFTEAEVVKRIADEGRYLSGLGVGGGQVKGLGATVGDGPREKGRTMLEAFFDPAHKDHRHARSIKDCYVHLTGDAKVTGRVNKSARFTEALDSTSFSEVLGDSITRRMIADYRTATEFDIWRELTGAPVPINDFRTQERTRFGGYGDLPIVAQRGSYDPLTSPEDEAASYAVAKRGGTETVTLEMIKNDDVGAIQRIPTRLSRAAKRTLSKFVLDFIRQNPTVYDGKKLFHADHGNLHTDALSAAAYAAARLAMVKQQEFGTADAIGVGPKYLWVPPELEEAAYNIFQRATNLDKTFVQTLVPTIVPVWYWTDGNDWAISADPLDIPTVEIGFLDGNEEPELFVQDSPTVGSFFTNDEITYKIRHIYGGAAVDFRGVAKSVVPAEDAG
ncbi:hypothetical protein [Mesorhizobium sp. KR1-2]|uniref:phage major capsid protein n=1 Tax=Mesorhizobium sp. KR1-2 TaxID=3156609 RepID=UPI0032B4F07E